MDTKDDQSGVKSALGSKTIHFNWISAAVWPLLPKQFREDPSAPAAVMAWFAIGNVILRFLTRTAIQFAIRPRSKNEGPKA